MHTVEHVHWPQLSLRGQVLPIPHLPRLTSTTLEALPPLLSLSHPYGHPDGMSMEHPAPKRGLEIWSKHQTAKRPIKTSLISVQSLILNPFSTILLFLNLWSIKTQRHFWHVTVKLRLLHYILINYRLTAGLYIYSYI